MLGISGQRCCNLSLTSKHLPVQQENGNLEMALHGSFLPVPAVTVFPELQEALVPGKVVTVPGMLSFNVGRKTVTVSVTNLSDRPIQVCALLLLSLLIFTQCSTVMRARERLHHHYLVSCCITVSWSFDLAQSCCLQAATACLSYTCTCK
jgi:hypothetical protein